MRKSFIIALVFGSLVSFLSSTSYGQGEVSNNRSQDVYPKIGWDSLKHRIIYPGLCNRIGITGAFNVFLDIDSNGQVLSSRIEPLNFQHVNNQMDSLLISALASAFRSTTWTSPNINGKPIRSGLTVPVMFILRNKNVTQPIIIDAKQILPVKGYTD